jgi:sodium-dependent dicarboxylate transporter 2/3/5
LLVACWALLLWLFPPGKRPEDAAGQRAAIASEVAQLGPVTPPERRLALVFGAVILAWISGSLLWYKWFPAVNDTVVAVAGALALFLLPARPAGREGAAGALLDWPTATRIPWGIILFFGGGLALARGFDQSGLATWMGEQMKGLQALPVVAIWFVVLLVVVALSELASNIATASMMMPVLAAVAASIGVDAFGLLLSATLAASFGFGLPVATAPNTIVYGSGYFTTRDMARAGFLLDVIAVTLLLVFVYGFLPFVK